MANNKERHARDVANNAAVHGLNGQDQMDLYILLRGGQRVLPRDTRPIQKKRVGVAEPGQG